MGFCGFCETPGSVPMVSMRLRDRFLQSQLDRGIRHEIFCRRYCCLNEKAGSNPAFNDTVNPLPRSHQGELLRPPENSVLQTIVFRNKEIKSGINCVRSIDKKVMFLSKYSLDRNNTIASLFRTQYTPHFLIAEYYGLRNTIFWLTEDLASDCGMFHKNFASFCLAKSQRSSLNFLICLQNWFAYFRRNFTRNLLTG
jgi:hypothetical protein